MPKPTSAFQPIQLADLAAITGGCGKKKQQCQPCPPPAPQQPPPAARPQAGAPEISTSVQISGYGSSTGATA